MPAPSRRLAALLAARLAEVLPPALTVRAEGASVTVYAGGEPQCGSAAAVLIEDTDDRDLDTKIETAVRAVLGGVQDCVLRYLGAPWPTVRPGGSFPSAGVRVEQGRVRLWYGDENAPEIELAAFETAELTN